MTVAPRFALLLASLLAPLPAQAHVSREVAAMGTWLRVVVAAPARPTALAASEAAVRAVEEVEARLSTWRPDSEIARANVTPVGQPAPLGPATLADLRFAFDLRARSGGAFDPTLGALLDAHGLRGEPRWPDAAELAAARRACGDAAVTLREGGLVRHVAAAWLATDAFAKGLALDRAGDAALAAGARAVSFDFGGQWAVRGRELEVALVHPWRRDVEVAMLRLPAGSSAATSGNGERAAAVGGRRLGHLFDPRTGQPAADFGSVTVVARSAALADAASTALFVLGIERGLLMAGQLGVEAVFVELPPPGDATGAAASPPVRLHPTPGLRAALRATGPAGGACCDPPRHP